METKLYSCEKCKYSSSNITNYNIHLKTKKHNEDKDKTFVCQVCNKFYKSYQCLWNHKQKCKTISCDLKSENHKLKVHNEELHRTIVELLKKQSVEPVINNIDNTTNIKINLNIFLNDQCKNAVNMLDFIKTIVFDLKDFESIEDTGYTQTKTNVILENLSKLTIFERPIHYIKKEDSIHIRDNDQWKIENSLEKPIFDTAMKELENTEYDDLYKTIKVTGVSHRGKNTTDYDINKFPQFTEIKGLLEGITPDISNLIIANVLESVEYLPEQIDKK